MWCTWLALSGLAGGCGVSGPDASAADPERASENYVMPSKSCIDDGAQSCFWNANGGSVPAGMRFSELGDCPVVRTQGIPWLAPVNPPAAQEPRLADQAFARELTWVTEQVEASACVCCHDSRTGSANIYDVAAGPSWVSAMTDRGLMMAAGIVDTHVLGAFPSDDNHGFDRFTTVFPTTDVERFRRFFLDELAYRGVTQDELDGVEPLGGPLTENELDVTEPCSEGTGVDVRGAVHWPGGGVRYAWIQQADAVNPGIPPNLDRPSGTLWYVGVHHEDAALASGELVYSSEPSGAAQLMPAAGEPPPALESGASYKLFLLRDHGQYLLRNCTFTYPIATSPP